MIFHVVYNPDARKDLRKLDSDTRKTILEWIDKNLEGCNDPRIHGKPLKGEKKGIWRYRVGNYRVFAQIRDNELLILIVEVGHRSTVYNR